MLALMSKVRLWLPFVALTVKVTLWLSGTNLSIVMTNLAAAVALAAITPKFSFPSTIVTYLSSVVIVTFVFPDVEP